MAKVNENSDIVVEGTWFEVFVDNRVIDSFC